MTGWSLLRCSSQVCSRGFLPLLNTDRAKWLLTLCFPDALCPRYSAETFSFPSNIYVLVKLQWKTNSSINLLLILLAHISFGVYLWNWVSIYDYKQQTGPLLEKSPKKPNCKYTILHFLPISGSAGQWWYDDSVTIIEYLLNDP